MAIASSLQHCSANISRLLRKRRERKELQALTPEERQQVAGELGMTMDQLEKLVAAGPEGSVEIERMMAALGVDSSKVNAICWKLMGELRVTCAQCGAKKVCRHALGDGSAAIRMHDFCPNAAELSERAERKDVAAA